jgi:hypothetical protein
MQIFRGFGQHAQDIQGGRCGSAQLLHALIFAYVEMGVECEKISHNLPAFQSRPGGSEGQMPQQIGLYGAITSNDPPPGLVSDCIESSG